MFYIIWSTLESVCIYQGYQFPVADRILVGSINAILFDNDSKQLRYHHKFWLHVRFTQISQMAAQNT